MQRKLCPIAPRLVELQSGLRRWASILLGQNLQNLELQYGRKTVNDEIYEG